MTDEQVEDLLRRYEPRAPDAAVGSRIVTAAVNPRSVTLRATDYKLLLAAAVFILAAILSDQETPRLPRRKPRRCVASNTVSSSMRIAARSLMSKKRR